jgi:rhodanese-related sulfurtransferase
MRHLTVSQLKERLAQGEPPVLLDVREAWEMARCSLPGATWIPMGQIMARVNELDKGKEIVVVCHHGIRSWQVAKYLEHEGFGNVINLTGGIDAWAKEVDPSMPLY